MTVWTNFLRLEQMTQVLEKPIDAGRAIAARRAYLDRSGMDIENATKGVLYQKMLSEIETGKKSVGKLKVNQLIALMNQLEWTPEDFQRETGITLPTVSPSPSVIVESLRASAIPTFSLVVSDGKGEIVATNTTISAKAHWSEGCEAYILEETKTHIHYIVVRPDDEYGVGDELFMPHPQKGKVVGKLEAEVGDTLILRTESETLTLSKIELKGKTGVVVRNARDRK